MQNFMQANSARAWIATRNNLAWTATRNNLVRTATRNNKERTSTGIDKICWIKFYREEK